MGLLGCDTTVPIVKETKKTSLYFSLYGQVGPEGGTVRVERLRDSINIGAPPSASETVTLTRKKTGSVDTLRRETERVGQLRVHNYRVPSLQPQEAYRIVVEGKKGNVSSATFTIPGKPKVQVLDTLQYCNSSLPGREYRARPVQVTIDSMMTIGRVAVKYLRLGGGSFSDSYPHTVGADRTGETSFKVSIRTNIDLLDLAKRPPPAIVTDASVTAIAVGRGWPGREFHTLTLEEIGIPNQHSNVRNGVGLVAGVNTTREEIPVDTSGTSGNLERLLNSLPDCQE